jgi:hypothetical protein
MYLRKHPKETKSGFDREKIDRGLDTAYLWFIYIFRNAIERGKNAERLGEITSKEKKSDKRQKILINEEQWEEEWKQWGIVWFRQNLERRFYVCIKMLNIISLLLS